MGSARLLIIGLDGATFSLLRPLARDGHLPELGRMMSTGLWGPLQSTVPPVTFPAWASFLCARNPRDHGVTDMFRLDARYGLCVAPSRPRQPTFLERLSDAELHVISLGVPGTFPPVRVRGVCISGFDAPGLSAVEPKGVWPRALHKEIQALGGWPFSTFNQQRGRAETQVASALRLSVRQQGRIALHLIGTRPWDVCFVHLQAPDTASHHLWHTYDPHSPRHLPLADLLPSVFREVDAVIGRLRLAAGPATRVLIVSDHGMGGAGTTAVHLNRWLRGLGLLKPTKAMVRTSIAKSLHTLVRALPQPALSACMRALPPHWTGTLLTTSRCSTVDFARSAAFSLELDYQPAIWLNRQTRFAHGTVSEGEVSELCAHLAERALELCGPNGEPLIAHVHRGQDLFGEHAGPDLVLEPTWPSGYRPSFITGGTEGPAVRTLARDELRAGRGYGMPGVHHPTGVLGILGPGLPTAELPPTHIAQAGLLPYALTGQPLPDGPVCLPEGLRALLNARRIRSDDAPPPATSPPDPSVLSRLQSWGYI